MTGPVVDALLELLVGSMGVAVLMPGFATFWLCLELAKTFDFPWLWDPSVIVAGVVGGVASYPFHQSLAQTAEWSVYGMGFAMYRSAFLGIAISSTCVFYLIWAEGSGRLEAPAPLAPIADRFRGKNTSD